MTSEGKSLTPELKLSIESGLHLALYAARPDISAIVHAHPVTATFFCTTNIPINMHLTAEAYVVAGEVVQIPYAMMGTTELARLVAENMKNCDCGLMENHGVITVGTTLLSAFDKMELLENAAKQTLMAHTIAAHCLTPQQLSELDSLKNSK
jgi:L-fuculose-phosphate aldolase